ncbi:MAG: ribosome-associated translation inhibitor RaiA [Gammaproteobacteria bacterium]|nr:ribosome-associated translation inhibitor RaiA [Gammaproteobacteria bacterium]
MSDIQITGRHLEVTDGIRQHIKDKFSKLERFEEPMTHPMMVIAVDKGVHFAEAKLHIMAHELFAKSESHDLYQAIDEVIVKLNTQISKLKNKLQDHHKPVHKSAHPAETEEDEGEV